MSTSRTPQSHHPHVWWKPVAYNRRTRKTLMAVLIQATILGVGTCSSAALGHADPLTSAEASFLQEVRSHAPGIGETDAQLLSDGWYACHNRAVGASITAMGVSPVVAQWALADLCPNGCPPPAGCHHF